MSIDNETEKEKTLNMLNDSQSQTHRKEKSPPSGSVVQLIWSSVNMCSTAHGHEHSSHMCDHHQARWHSPQECSKTHRHPHQSASSPSSSPTPPRHKCHSILLSLMVSLALPCLVAAPTPPSAQDWRHYTLRPTLSVSQSEKSLSPPSSVNLARSSRYVMPPAPPSSHPYRNGHLLSIPISAHSHMLAAYQQLPRSAPLVSNIPSAKLGRYRKANSVREVAEHDRNNNHLIASTIDPKDDNRVIPSKASRFIDAPNTALDKTKGSKWWDIANHSPESYPNTVALEGQHGNSILPVHTEHMPSAVQLALRKKQRRLIKDNPGMLSTISRAMKTAIHECQAQFKDRRWNCPVTDWKKDKNVFGKIVQKGCRETAFVYALTSAAVAHAIARGCAEGQIETCECDYRQKYAPPDMDWQWGGCSDNTEFGYKFAKAFVDAAERGRDLRFVMNLHNNEVGRIVAHEVMEKECKCHGMSGSCTMKTCWMRLPNFGEVGNRIKDRFDGASRVMVSNDYRGITRKMFKKVQLRPYENGYKTPTKTDLIYFEESPDFCEPNPKYGVSGTQGRLCNATSVGVDSCNLLCCGRGYITEEREVFERCNCTFHWCCQVHCRICKKKKKIYRCK